MLESGIVALLKADQELTALIGSRLYAVLVDEGTDYPCMRFLPVASPPPDLTLDGAATNETRVQFDCYAGTYKQAKTVQARLRDILSGYSGVLSDGTEVKGCLVQNELDLFEDGPRVFPR